MYLGPEIHVGETVYEEQLNLARRECVCQCNALAIRDQVVTAPVQQDDLGP